MHDVSTDPSLYQARQKIHPLQVAGPFQTVRIITILITLTVYFVGPWLIYHGRQAVYFDLPERKFFIFHYTFWPQDFFLLSWLLIISALSLFFITVFAGRMWCGYTCPQTVWTKVFHLIEELVEGNRAQRIKLDNSKLTLQKFLKRVLKHILWIAISLETAFTFVGYFSPIRELVPRAFHLTINHWEAIWLVFFTLATYINAGWMREQVCIYMCPYARFQSVMFDQQTLIVSYDKKRGDPRGARSRKSDPKQLKLGDCINCYQCVHVCPTGIDIRDGLQMQCIGCAACIDACNRIMKKMDYPQGLIRYTTEEIISGQSNKNHILRPRLIGYGIILLLMCCLFLYALINRPLIELDVIHDRNVLYRIDNDGNVENTYLLKIINKSQEKQIVSLSLPEDFRFSNLNSPIIELNPEAVYNLATVITASPASLPLKSNKFTVKLSCMDATCQARKETRFIKP